MHPTREEIQIPEVCQFFWPIMYIQGPSQKSGLDILDNNIFHNSYVSETYILYWLARVQCGHEVIVIYDVT